MTLDEAIKHAEAVAEEKFNSAVYIMDKMKSDVALENAEECKRCAEEHRQLAEWLKELKQLREQEPCDDAISRQAVLNTLYALCDTGETLIENPWRDNPHIDAVVEIIEQLPPVKPQYTQDEIQKMQELEQAELEKAYELGKAEIERDDMAIKALEQSSYISIKNELNGDTISRQAVLDTEYQIKEINGIEYVMLSEVQMKIRKMPPVNPQQKTGHWSRKTKVDAYDIAGVKTWGIKCQCDRCDFTTIVVEDFGYYKYCPNCGAKMVDPQEGSGEE